MVSRQLDERDKKGADLLIGDVLVGEYMKRSSLWTIIASTAAIVSAIAAITSVVLLLVLR